MIRITGKDIISLRGYEVSDIPANDPGAGGATVFDKFTMELRYPLSLNPSSTISADTYSGIYLYCSNFVLNDASC